MMFILLILLALLLLIKSAPSAARVGYITWYIIHNTLVMRNNSHYQQTTSCICRSRTHIVFANQVSRPEWAFSRAWSGVRRSSVSCPCVSATPERESTMISVLNEQIPPRGVSQDVYHCASRNIEISKQSRDGPRSSSCFALGHHIDASSFCLCGARRASVFVQARSSIAVGYTK